MNRDLLVQMINEASTPREFAMACVMAESHVQQGRADTGLVAHLAVKGHALLVKAGPSARIGISLAVMRVADAEPAVKIQDNEGDDRSTT